MRLPILIQITILALSFSCIAAQSGSERVKQYEVILYEGAAPERYLEESRKDLKLEEPRLSMRVEEGEKFHAEGNGAMFEGKILSVKDGKIELRIDRSRLASTGCDDISASVGLNEAVSPRVCSVQSIIFLYYFRVKSVTKDGTEDQIDCSRLSSALEEQPTRLRILKGESPLSSIARFRRLAYPTSRSLPSSTVLGCISHICLVAHSWETCEMVEL